MSEQRISQLPGPSPGPRVVSVGPCLRPPPPPRSCRAQVLRAHANVLLLGSAVKGFSSVLTLHSTVTFGKDCDSLPYHFLGLLAPWFVV